ncbi:MAG: enoyl-CoA hydratase/isomerase family protein [Oceanococcus sp.]
MYSAEQALAWMAEGLQPVAFSAFGEHPALLLDLASTQGLPQSEDLATWLRSLACPVIGLRDPDISSCLQPAEAQVSSACDVVVDDVESAEQLLEKIRQHPLAAASFVDVLRVTESMPAHQALSVESAVFACLQGGAEYAAWMSHYEAGQVADTVGPALLQERDGKVLRLVLNRPNNRNAMSVEMRDALVDALRMVAQDDSIARVHISGNGTCFSTGGDLKEFGLVPDTASGHIIRMLSVPGKFMLPVAPRVHAHVHGSCIGSGIEFPAFAGRITASADAWFQLPEVGMGLIPGAGGCISLARRIGRQRLAWMGLSGKKVSAQLALVWGLIDEIC